MIMLFTGYILGIITMLLIFSPVMKTLTKFIPPEQTDIDENDYVFYDIPNNDGE